MSTIAFGFIVVLSVEIHDPLWMVEMRDAIIGICAGFLMLSAMAFSCSENAPTIQNVFEDYEKHKAEKQMQEQIEQAKRTIEQQKAEQGQP